jgi:hypothetical protein
MNRLATGPVALALIILLGLTGALTADAAYYYSGKYRFIYSSSADLSWARSLWSKLGVVTGTAAI